MAKRRVGSRTASLTPDHKKSGIDPIYLAAGSVPHIIGKLLTRTTILLYTAPQSEVYSQSYGAPKSRESDWWDFGTPTRESREKEPFGCSLRGELQSIL